jgi:hypothetical protein
MLTPRKLIAFLTLALTFSSTLAFADCESLGLGWVQGTSSGGITVCVPTGDNPDGAISSGEPVLTQNGKDYYAPPSSMADKLTVDSTGRIGRTLDEITRITRLDGSVYIYTTSVTFYTEAGAASTAVWDKVKADPASFPALSTAVSSSSQPPAPFSGVVVSVSGLNYKALSLYQSNSINSADGRPGVGGYYISVSGYLCYVKGVAPGTNQVYVDTWTKTSTTDPITPLILDNSKLSVAVTSSGAAAASDIDKLISQNPDSFKKSYTPSANEGLTSPPIPTALTPEKIAEIEISYGPPAGDTGGNPVPGPGGIPQLPPTVEIPQTPPEGSDPSAPPPKDVYGPGYTPGYNNSPYGSDIPGGADFGIRMSQFMTDLRGSSLFSLPTSILGNIPGSGTSAISFDGGMFGQQSFDFAAFSNQWVIIRSVLYLCFCLLSIRIVTLKR